MKAEVVVRCPLCGDEVMLVVKVTSLQWRADWLEGPGIQAGFDTSYVHHDCDEE